MIEKIEGFEEWFKEQPNWKRFLVATGIIAAGLVGLAIAFIIVITIFVQTAKAAIFISPLFWFLFGFEILLALSAILASIFLSDM